MATIKIWDGVLCLEETDSSWSEPVLVTRVLATELASAGFEDLVGKRAYPLRHATNIYEVDLGHATYQLRLRDSDEGLPILVIKAPIRKPKTTLRTRYIQGGWQKLSAKHGWIQA